VSLAHEAVRFSDKRSKSATLEDLVRAAVISEPRMSTNSSLLSPARSN
jgi:hypothetical protein